MFIKHLQPPRVSVPRGVALASYPPLPMENVTHTPGQNAAIRFFDPQSAEDLQAMQDILGSKQSRKWMDDTQKISKSDYQEWAGAESNTSFLFAILDARAQTPEEMNYVRGFVYIYSEREEKFRVRRMERLGFITPSDHERYVLEVSFALRPLGDGIQAGSGLMGSALRQSCLQVQMLLNSVNRPEIDLFAFCSPENEGAKRTVESAGFRFMGQMKYDWDSPQNTDLYILNWRVLQKKIRERLLATLQPAEPAV